MERKRYEIEKNENDSDKNDEIKIGLAEDTN
jgi:hypothetical protein